MLGWALVRGGVLVAGGVSLNVALGSSRCRVGPSALLANGRNVGESSPLSSSSTSSTLLRGVFFCRWNGGGRLNIWLCLTGGSFSSSESDDSDVEDGEAGGDAAASPAVDSVVGSALREVVVPALPRNERCTGWRGDAGGRKCLLCVTVAADGVLDSSVGLIAGVPGGPISPLGTGLSLDRIDNAEGALGPPLPSLFIGMPPTTDGC